MYYLFESVYIKEKPVSWWGDQNDKAERKTLKLAPGISPQSLDHASM